MQLVQSKVYSIENLKGTHFHHFPYIRERKEENFLEKSDEKEPLNSKKKDKLLCKVCKEEVNPEGFLEEKVYKCRKCGDDYVMCSDCFELLERKIDRHFKVDYEQEFLTNTMQYTPIFYMN